MPRASDSATTIASSLTVCQEVQAPCTARYYRSQFCRKFVYTSISRTGTAEPLMFRHLTLPLVVTAAVVAAAQRPSPVSVAATEWRYYAGDAASTKYSPLAQITRDNVKDLEVAWRWSSVDNDVVK